MVTEVETLGKLERRLTLSISLNEVQAEVEKRLRVRARTAKENGYRVGKVPMKMLAEKYGYQIKSEVLGYKIRHYFEIASKENELDVVGSPRIESRNEGNASEGAMLFEANFEVYPKIEIGDLNATEVEIVKTEVGDAEVDKTIQTLRKQRATYCPKGSEAGGREDRWSLAEKGDRVTIDFSGRIDGKEFQGGKAP